MSSFNSYEYAGYIIPGAILLLGLILLFPLLRERFVNIGDDKQKFGFSELGIFLMIAFALGHALHASGHFFDQWHPKSCTGGIYGTNVVVYDRNQSVLSAKEMDELSKKVEAKYDVRMSGLNLRDPKDLLVWCNATFKMIDDVYVAKRNGLLDTYLRDYGLYLGLAAAFTILVLAFFAILVLPRIRPSWLMKDDAQGYPILRWALAGELLMFLFVGAFISFYRFFYFAWLYVGELYLQFISI